MLADSENAITADEERVQYLYREASMGRDLPKFELAWLFDQARANAANQRLNLLSLVASIG